MTNTTKSKKKSLETLANAKRGTAATRASTFKKLPEELELSPPPPGEPRAKPKEETTELPGVQPLPLTEGEESGPFKRDETVSKSLAGLIAPSTISAKACLIVMRGHQVGRMYELGDEVAEIGRSHDVKIAIADEAVSRRHATVHSSSLGFVVTDTDSTNGLFVNSKRVRRHVLRDGDRIQFGTSTVLKFAFQDELEETLHQKLYDGATRDQLVGAHNRRYLVDSLRAAFASANRRGRPLSASMLDIDYFKRVNDTYGHLAGDHVLKGVAKLIQDTIRAEDVFARFGGEEFALLLPESDREAAVLVAERVRASIEGHAFEYEGASIEVTISIGVATLAGGNYTSPKALIAAADTSLYEAKRAGRNRVVWGQGSARTQAPRAEHS